jgi:hypothetical protein
MRYEIHHTDIVGHDYYIVRDTRRKKSLFTKDLRELPEIMIAFSHGDGASYDVHPTATTFLAATDGTTDLQTTNPELFI